MDGGQMVMQQKKETTESLQKYLDDNVRLIHQLLELQRTGGPNAHLSSESTRIQHSLHANLIYLATLADQQQPPGASGAGGAGGAVGQAAGSHGPMASAAPQVSQPQQQAPTATNAFPSQPNMVNSPMRPPMVPPQAHMQSQMMTPTGPVLPGAYPNPGAMIRQPMPQPQDGATPVSSAPIYPSQQVPPGQYPSHPQAYANPMVYSASPYGSSVAPSFPVPQLAQPGQEMSVAGAEFASPVVSSVPQWTPVPGPPTHDSMGTMNSVQSSMTTNSNGVTTVSSASAMPVPSASPAVATPNPTEQEKPAE